MRGKYVLLGIFLTLVCCVGSAWAADVESEPFLVEFDSYLTSSGEDLNVTSRVSASFLINQIEGELGRFRGVGRLHYTALSGIPNAVTSDGVLFINDMQVSANDGTVVVKLFPGNPGPNEWIIFPPASAQQFFHWFGVFIGFHTAESGVGGITIENWEYPDGEVYARKTYSGNLSNDGVYHTEETTIELIPVPDPPRIDKINIDSKGFSAKDPETGEEVELSADIYLPFLYQIERCTWTGNNFTGSGIGDPDDDCRWTYTPKEGEGPRRDTYGDKNLTLTVTFKYGATQSHFDLARSENYKVFFTKKGDDDSNSKPNWFDYWGDDGAVPGLDGSNVDYDASIDYFGYFQGSTVFMGPIAADSDGSITVPANPICVGGTFPGSEGIDTAAITLAHERRHADIAALGGTDTDSDGVPDGSEAGTSPTNPDSCSLATVIDADYATYGDDEFIARRAELGVKGVNGGDWALPGRQATIVSSTALIASAPTSGIVLNSGPQSVPALSQSMGQAASLAANGTLTGSYNAVGQDPDVGGFFSSMRLDIGVNIVEADNYFVIAWLEDDLGKEILWANTSADLGPGNTTLQVEFDGPLLNQAGVTQPFMVSRVELYYRVGKHRVLAASAENVLNTGYDSADFQPPLATLADTITEQAVDTGVDGLYDYLDITVDVDINEPGEFELSAQLHGSSMVLDTSQVINIPGSGTTEQVTLRFDGSLIFFHRENGPYQLKMLRLRENTQRKQLDFQADAFTTSAFQFSEFQNSGIVIDENSYTDSGGELDSDGKFVTLDLMFNISSTVPGPYTILASLEDSKGGTIAKVSTAVGLGGVEGFAELAPVMLSFDGKEIFAAGLDGPYQVADVTVISDGGIVMDQNPVPWLTAAYEVGDFGVVVLEEIILKDGFE
jgi:hypothetical protein